MSELMVYDELMGLMRQRRSIRRFQSRPVASDLVEKILEATRWAPSAGNRQSFRFLVVRSGETLKAMEEVVKRELVRVEASLREDLPVDSTEYLNNFTHFAGAPLVVAPIRRDSSDTKLPYGLAESLSSVSASIMQMLLAVEALGLGACWMTGPLAASSSLERILSVPQGWSLAALIPVGYPAEEPAPPARRKLEKLISYID